MYSGIQLFSVIYSGIPAVTHCGILFFQWCKVAYYFKLVHGVFEVLIIPLLLFIFLFTLKSTSAPSLRVCLLLQPADSLFSSHLLHFLATFFRFFWNSVSLWLPPAPQSWHPLSYTCCFLFYSFQPQSVKKMIPNKEVSCFFLFLFTLKCTSAPSVCVCLCLSEILKISDILEISEILKNSEFLKIFWNSESFWSPKNFWKSGGKPSTEIEQDLNAHEDWKVSLTSQELHHSPSNDHAARGW